MHAVGSPKLNIVCIMMWLFNCAFVTWIPCADAIIHAFLHHGKYFFQPVIVAANSPFAIYFHDPSQLTIGCRMKLMCCRLYGQHGAKILMSFLILAFTKLSITQCAFQCGNKIRE